MRPHLSTIVIALIAIALVSAGAIAFTRMKAPVVEVPQLTITPPDPRDSIIGASVEGRDIHAYTYGDGATHVVFVGGMHGGYEWNSVLLAYQFMDYLKAYPGTVPSGVTVTVIPDLNPDAVFKAVGKEGRFAEADVPSGDLSAERFNADDVDLNRNFDCHWEPTGTWKSTTVSAGSAPFSEPEARAMRDYALSVKPAAVIFWHSAAGGVYASECAKGVLPQTVEIMNAYAKASGYPAIESFDAYPVTGDSEGWLASIGVPALTVELTKHDSVEWSENLAGIKAVLSYYGGGALTK